MKALLIFHIVGGSLGIISGFSALFSAKGSNLHRKSGQIFVGSMLMLGLTASVIGLVKGETGNVFSGLIASYMVVTGFSTVRPLSRGVDIVAMLLATVAATATLASGIVLAAQGKYVTAGVPVLMVLFLGTVIALAAYGDFRIIRNGALRGSKRIVRHLWRMCFALFIASGSFFSIRKRVSVILPEALLGWPPRLVPILLPLLAIMYWLWRIRFQKNLRPVRLRRPEMETRPLEVA